ncbi:hypothetical protein BGZ73_001053 [Actinomortierella ambigua]|nr:hypothetical protein BGZ73_001053 [Actinomortierella ambigua]
MATLVSIATVCCLLSLTSTSLFHAVEASPVPATKEQLRWFASHAVQVDQDPISLMILPRKPASSVSKDTKKAPAVAAMAAALDLKEKRDLSAAAVIVTGSVLDQRERQQRRRQHHSLYLAYDAIVSSDSQMPVFLPHDHITRQGKKSTKHLSEGRIHTKPLRPFVRLTVPSSSLGDKETQARDGDEEEEEEDQPVVVQVKDDIYSDSDIEKDGDTTEPKNNVNAVTNHIDEAVPSTSMTEVISESADEDNDDNTKMGHQEETSPRFASPDNNSDDDDATTHSSGSISASSEPALPCEFANDEKVAHDKYKYSSADRVSNAGPGSSSQQQTSESQTGDHVLHDILLKIAPPNTVKDTGTHHNEFMHGVFEPLHPAVGSSPCHDDANALEQSHSPYSPSSSSSADPLVSANATFISNLPYSTLQWLIAGFTLAVMYLCYRVYVIQVTKHHVLLPYTQQQTHKDSCVSSATFPHDQKQVSSSSSSSSSSLSSPISVSAQTEEAMMMMVGARNRSFSNSSSNSPLHATRSA